MTMVIVIYLFQLRCIICTIDDIGDNHFGYVGFRDANGAWIDDGAMNVVIDNWNSQQ
jgi:hypothetical protein